MLSEGKALGDQPAVTTELNNNSVEIKSVITVGLCGCF